MQPYFLPPRWGRARPGRFIEGERVCRQHKLQRGAWPIWRAAVGRERETPARWPGLLPSMGSAGPGRGIEGQGLAQRSL